MSQIAPLFRAPTLIRSRNGRAMVLGLAAITMTVELGSLLAGELVTVGSIRLSASILPSLAVLAALGARSIGTPGERERLVPFWIAMAAGLGLGVSTFAKTDDLADLVALLLAAVNEEVVYRFAVPVVIATALMVLRTPSTLARGVGYVIAGTWWVFLPGHQAQTDSAGALLTYAAFAVISTMVVVRSRALLPMAVAHCVLNVITITAERGDITSASRGALSGCLLFILVATFAWPGDRAPVAEGEPVVEPEDLITDTVIDLRDGQRPSVSHGAEVTYLDELDEPGRYEVLVGGSSSDERRDDDQPA